MARIAGFPLTKAVGAGARCEPELPPALIGPHGITGATVAAALAYLPNGFYATGVSTDRVVKVQPFTGLRGQALVQIVYPRAHFGDEDAEVVGCATAAQHLIAFLFGVEIVEGLTHFSEYINQGERPCEVLAVKRTRFRIGFDMPNCEQEGWRHGTVIKGRMFYRPR